MGSEFPYTLSTMCYIEVAKDGSVTWGSARESYERALTGDSTLYAVWPGQWSSHLFVIDDLDQYARGLGIRHDEERTGLTDHVHNIEWSISPYESKPSGSYVTIELRLACGCSIKDLRAFATQMHTQKGWDIATTTGWGSSWNERDGTTYSIRVRRKSLFRARYSRGSQAALSQAVALGGVRRSMRLSQTEPADREWIVGCGDPGRPPRWLNSLSRSMCLESPTGLTLPRFGSRARNGRAPGVPDSLARARRRG